MNNCKFQKLQYQVSYDSGSTWQPVVPQRTKGGALIEYDSQDCTAIGTMYRWRVLDGEYICDGHSKYVKEVRDESYNGGTTWYTSYPTVYRTGQYVGEDAVYCREDKFVGHYIPSEEDPVHSCKKYYIWNGFSCVYVDPIKVVKCPDYPYTESYITTGITKYYTSGYTLSHCTIGDCVTGIGDRAFFEQTAMTRINSDVEGEAIIPSGVTSIGESAFLHCNGLRTIDLPSGITSIGASAFTDDYMVSSVYLRAPLPPKLGESAFTNVTFANACGIYVPCITAYLHSYNWRNYRDRLHILPDSQGCEFKLMASHWGSSSGIATNDFSVSCNDSSVLSSGETYLDQNRYETTDVVIGNCVTEIGDSAFSMVNAPSLYDYGGWLSSVTISDSVTEIGDDAFHSCKRLSAITIPDSVTTIGNSAFQKCIDLGINTTIDIPSGVTTISDSLFKNCYNSACTRGLSAVRISPNVTSIGNSAFYDCKALRRISLYGEADQTSYSVYIPTACTTIGELAFYNTDPYMFNIPSSVTTIGNSAFEGCSGSSFTISAVVPPTLGTDAFKNACIPDGIHNPPKIIVPCESLEEYSVTPGWKDLVNKMYTSSGCTAYRWYPSGTTCVGYDKYENVVKQVTTDGGNTWTNVTPEQYSATTLIEAESYDCGAPERTKWFGTYQHQGQWDTRTSSARCTSSTTIVSGEIPARITHPDSQRSFALIEIELGDCVESLGTQVFDGFNYLKKATIPDTISKISNYTFRNCTALKQINNTTDGYVTLPYIEEIGVSAFCGCQNIVNVWAPDAVYFGTGAFSGCTNLYRMTFSSNDAHTIDNYAFKGCTSLKRFNSTTDGVFNIPDSVTLIGSGAFANCTSMTEVNIPYLSGYSQTDNLFSGCTSLSSVTLSEEGYGTGKGIGQKMFAGCSNLKYFNSNVSGMLDIPSGVTSISGSAFSGCSSITKVSIPDSVRGFGSWAFYNCGALTEVTIGDGVYSIGDEAFNGCTSLYRITIGSGVTSIGQGVFQYCSNLNRLTIKAVTPPALHNSYIPSNCWIYVPSESVDTYKAASGWSSHASYIRAIT